MAVDKYYRTLICKVFTNISDFGYESNRHQFEIVCKAKSRVEANRIAESLGIGKNVFKANYASETRNKIQIDMCDKLGGFIINANGTTTTNQNYIDIKLLNGVNLPIDVITK